MKCGIIRELIQSLLPPDKEIGRPRTTNLRAVLNAIFYIVVAGCAWRMLPRDFPPCKTVYHYFRKWRIDKTWEEIHHKFVEWERVAQGREPVPSAASMDSQSVKTATIAATPVGYDGGKKIKGGRAHMGLVKLVTTIIKRLRSATKDLRNIYLCGYDSYYAQATSVVFEFSDIL